VKNLNPLSVHLWTTYTPCRLDYCNSLFNGISDGLMTRL